MKIGGSLAVGTRARKCQKSSDRCAEFLSRDTKLTFFGRQHPNKKCGRAFTMESPRANDTPLGVNRIAPQYEGEEAASDDWVITKISKVEKERSTETSDTDVSGSSSDGNAILVETVVSSDSESDIEDMGKQAFYSEMSRYGQPEISPGYESESEAVHDDSMALPLPPPLDTPIPLKERVLSDESKGAQSIFSGTTVVATNTHPNASSDEPFAHESTVSSEDDDEEASKKSTLQSRRRRSFTFCGIIVALFLSSTAFIFFGTGLHKSLRGAPDVQTQTPGAPAPPTSTPPPAASRLIDILRPASGDFLAYPGSPQFQAFQWMSIEDAIATDPQTSPARIQQRYALVLLYTALSGEIPSFAVNDECEWPTVTCGASGVVSTARAAVDGQVTEIRMARQGFTGNIPSEIKLLQDSLVHLDLAENQYLHGIVPEELYELTNLKSLYLHDNVMRGTISESIKKLQNLEDLYLQNNRFEGSIPYNLGSRQGIRPLRK